MSPFVNIYERLVFPSTKIFVLTIPKSGLASTRPRLKLDVFTFARMFLP